MFSIDLVMWRRWRMTGYAKRLSVEEFVITQGASRGRKRYINTVNLKIRKRKRFGCQASKENGA